MRNLAIRALAAVGGLALLAAVVAGTYAAALLRGGLSARDRPTALEERVARAARALAVPRRVRSRTNPVAATPEVLALARAHWADHCAVCHANDGSGDTSLGRNLYPKAPDMRAAPTQGLSDGELYEIIQNGIRLSGMPAWGEGGDDDKETWALVAFIRHLPAATPDEIRSMEAMNPRSVEEWRELQDEEAFLRGEPAGAADHESGHSPAH